MFRLFALGALLTFLVAPQISRAAPDATVAGPTILLRVQSVDKLLDNAEYLAGIVGKQDEAKQALGFIKALAGEKGIEGVDTKRPFVLYANLNEEITKSDAVVMIPIADQESFIGLLKNRIGLEVKDEKEGLFSVEAPNNAGTVYFRFVNKYVYATYLNKANVDEKKVAKPEDLIGKDGSVISLSVRVDRIPKELKTFALGTIEQGLAKGKEAPIPNETEKIKAVKEKAIDSLAKGFKAILEEGEEVKFQIDIDPKTDELALDISMSAKKGTPLAKDIADLTSRKSVAFGSLASMKAALFLAANVSLPESIKSIMGPAIDEAVKTGLGMAPNEIQEMLAPLVQTLMPTLKAGDLDGGVLLIGPSAEGHYTGVLAGKIAGGKEIEKAVKDLVKKAPAEIQAMIKLDADSDGDTKLHMVNVKDKLDDKARKMFGDAELWLAFRDDAVVVAFGTKAKESLKAALKSPPAVGPISEVDVSVSRLIALAENADVKNAQKIAKEIFGDDATGDKITLTLKGGESVRLRASMKGKVVKFFAALDKAKNEK